MDGKKIIIYGAGNYGKILYEVLENEKANIYAFCETKVHVKKVKGIEVISFDSLKYLRANEYKIYIAIANQDVSKEIKNNILSLNSEYTVCEFGSFIREKIVEKTKNIKSLNYRSIDDMNRVIREKYFLLPNIDYVIGIPRSGLIPATIIALLINKPVITINDFLYTDYDKHAKRYTERVDVEAKTGKTKVLVIDDSCASGRRINKAREEIEREYKRGEIEVIYSSVYVTEESSTLVDFYFDICEMPRVFEWNIMNHPILSESALDLDGVLCVDPTNEQNDDGEKYIDFIRNAIPLIRPKYEIGAIITSRLEKYRKETADWLRKNGIKYKELIMLDLPDKDSRIKFDAHATFKAEIYGNSDYELYIESNNQQAKKINELTNKQVYSVESRVMYKPIDTIEYYIKQQKINDEIKFKCNELLYELKDIQLDGLIAKQDNNILQFVEIFDKLNLILNSYSINNGRFKIVRDINYYLIGVLSNREKLINYIQKIDIDGLEKEIECACNEIMINVANKVNDVDWNQELNYVENLLTDELILSDKEMEEYKTEIEYIRKEKRLMLYPYEFEKDYDLNKVEVLFDKEKNLKYVNHNGKKLWFPNQEDSKIKYDYNQLIMEQDYRSPHTYFDKNICVKEGDIFIDVGAAEGLISLDIVEMASEIYLIECSSEWIEALNETFKPYSNKIHIIPKYAGRDDDDVTISLDSLLKNYRNKEIFIKMDVEGMELDVLKGSREVLKNNNCKISCATYHTNDAYNDISKFFEREEYKYKSSEGNMLFFYGYMVMKNGKYTRIEKPYFRKALIRASNTESITGL